MKNKILRALIVLVVVVTFAIALMYAFHLLYPFIFAIAFAIIINPIVNFFTRYIKVSRGLAVFITMVLLFGALSLIIFYSSVELIAGIKYLLEFLPTKVDALSQGMTDLIDKHVVPFLDQVSNIYNGLSGNEQQDLLKQIDKVKNEWIAALGGFLEGVLNNILGLIQSLPSLATSIIFGLLGTFFISKDWYKLKDKLKQLMPETFFIKLTKLNKGLKAALVGFLKAQAILISVTIVLLIIGLLILQVKSAFTVGLLIGLVDVLPYLGTGLVLVPWSIYEIVMGDLFLGIGLAVIYAVLVIVRQIIEPKILSSNIGLDTLATIVSMFLGLQLFGVLGLVIGPVVLVIITTCIKIHVFKDIWHYIKNGRGAKTENEDQLQ